MYSIGKEEPRSCKTGDTPIVPHRFKPINVCMLELTTVATFLLSSNLFAEKQPNCVRRETNRPNMCCTVEQG